VIGGLILATTATLLFVPVVFSLVHGRQSRALAKETLDGESSHVA
jgi:Cu/Ag efflux pump CusA